MKNVIRSLIVGLMVLSLGMMVVGCDDTDTENNKVIAEQYRGLYTEVYPNYTGGDTIELKEKTVIYTGVERRAWTEINSQNGTTYLYFENNNDFGYNWRFEDGDLCAAPQIGGDVIHFRK